MKDSTLWIGVGGLAAAGVYLWWRQPDPIEPDWIDELTAEIDSWGLGSPARQSSLPASGPGPYTQLAGPAPVARLGPTGPSGGDIAIKSGFAVGTGAAVGAIGPGSILAGTLTAGIGAAVGVLAWAIGSKGLFRGGAEALYVNPARDRYIAFWGPPGTGPESGFHKLAHALTVITGESGGGRYFTALNQADTQEKLIDATLDIQRVFASVGQSVPAYVE